MAARVCTCIRAEDARVVAVPDPTCPHESAAADHDAHRAARALGRALAWAAVLAICIALWTTTHWTAWHWTIAGLNTLAAVRLATTGDTP